MRYEIAKLKKILALFIMAALLSTIGYLAARIIGSKRKLQLANVALSAANKDLFGLNRALQRDRAVERVRAEVTAMTSAEDLSGVLEEMLREL